MTSRPTSSSFSDRPSRPEQLARLWHELHWCDATHPGGADEGWWTCRACRMLNPYHRAARIAAVADIWARLIDSMASTTATQKERAFRTPQDNWRRST